jgi:hypothetical protein
MKHTNRSLPLAAALLFAALLSPAASRAGALGTEVWLGTGVSWPDYHEKPIACVRAGLGLVFRNVVGFGISGQADKDRVHYFGNASVTLPTIGLVEPYGRFEMGRRDDRDDTAWGWVAGLRTGEEAIRFYLEANQIVEPEKDFGLSIGIAF